MSRRSTCHERYLLLSPDLKWEERTSLRESGDLNCRMCGLSPGEIDFTTGQRALLYAERSGSSVISPRWEITCSICSEGRAEMQREGNLLE